MPIIFKDKVFRETEYVIWQIEESESQLLQLAQLDKEDLKTLETFRHAGRRSQWLSVRALAASLISSGRRKICYDANGKPFLQSGAFQISVSHTAGYAAISLSMNRQSGIDIEQIHPRIRKVRERFLHDDERAFTVIHDSLDMLFLYWCGKEALYKLHGQPGLDFQNSIRIDPIDYLCTQGGTASATIFQETGNTRYLLSYKKLDNLMIVLAAEAERPA